MRIQLKKRTNTYKVTLIIFTFLYLSINTVNAQGSVDVFGTVQDSISQPLSLITVILFDIDNQYIYLILEPKMTEDFTSKFPQVKAIMF